MTPEQWLKENLENPDSMYEAMFVRSVLSRVENMDFHALRAQMPFCDKQGRQRYCDFAIREGIDLRVAIEIDGFDKRGTGFGMTKDEFLDWQRRHAALVADGWDVIRFSNIDVRDRPETCAEHLNLLLRRERKKRSHQERIKEELANLELRLEKSKQDNEKLKRKERALQQKHGKIEVDGKQATDRASLLKELSSLKSQLQAAQNARKLDPQELKNLQALRQAQNKAIVQGQKLNVIQSENSIMKHTIWAFTALLGLVIVVLVFQIQGPQGLPLTSQDAELPDDTEQTAEKPSAQDGANCDNPITWRDAGDFVGRTVSVSGRVFEVTRGASVEGGPTWINLGAPFPDNNRFTLIIWERNLDSFAGNLEDRLLLEKVCATGKVGDFQGIAQIELRHPRQLTILP